MSDQFLIRNCAPTLAGLKTGNLFSVRVKEEEDMLAEIRRINKVLVPRGLRALMVKRKENLALIYIYRPAMLREDLKRAGARQILQEKGYPADRPEHCIVRLVKQLAVEDAFPHEIGLFLGYPPEDVKGFMNHPKEGVLCCGCWKVYGNREAAEQKFQCFRKCTQDYCRRADEGNALAHLIVNLPA